MFSALCEEVNLRLVAPTGKNLKTKTQNTTLSGPECEDDCQAALVLSMSHPEHTSKRKPTDTMGTLNSLN